jgi:hypothetical protein
LSEIELSDKGVVPPTQIRVGMPQKPTKRTSFPSDTPAGLVSWDEAPHPEVVQHLCISAPSTLHPSLFFFLPHPCSSFLPSCLLPHVYLIVCPLDHFEPFFPIHHFPSSPEPMPTSIALPMPSHTPSLALKILFQLIPTAECPHPSSPPRVRPPAHLPRVFRSFPLLPFSPLDRVGRITTRIGLRGSFASAVLPSAAPLSLHPLQNARKRRARREDNRS